MDIDDHAEELASDLGVDKAEVAEQLSNLLEYRVPVEEAKSSIRRKYGGDDGGGGAAPSAVDVGEIGVDDGPVTVTGRVLTLGTRSIRYQGEEQTIREGELADATGRISYTMWEEFGVEAGDSVTVGNASVREWEGEPELNVGGSSTVTTADPVEVPYEVGGERALRDLRPGDRGRVVEVRVLEANDRTIDGRDGETTIREGVVGDESARLPFTDWQRRDALRAGADLRLSDVYVREFRGVPQVNLTEFTTVESLDRAVDVPEDAPRLTVAEAVGAGGLFDVEVVANVIGVRDGSGLIERCPDCSRVVQNGQCRAHGEVDAEDDLRVKAILDDGTETLTAVLDADLTAEVYGGGLDEARAAATEAMDRGVVRESVAESIVGRSYRVRGNLSVDEYGANLDATAFEPADESPAELASALLADLRGEAGTEAAE
jgi:replication factor A1